MNTCCVDPEITIVSEPNRVYRVDLTRDGKCVSRCWIVGQTIAVGHSQVDMGGIAGVGTDDEFRNQGLSRRVLQEAIRFMEQADFGLTMLYGIPDYYHKFGYASAGPHRGVKVSVRTEPAVLPTGWHMRALQTADIPELQRIYAQHLALNVCGARIRPEGSHFWSELTRIAAGERDDECIVLTAPDGHLAAYAWHGIGSCHHDWYEQFVPETFVVSEAMAEDPKSADMLLTACELWLPEVASKRNRVWTSIEYAVTEEGEVAAALMRRDCEFRQEYKACAGCMVRTANLDQLCENMMPEWRRLVRGVSAPIDKAISFKTDRDTRTLHVGGGRVTLCPESGDAECIELSAGEFGQLVLGVIPAHDVLTRLAKPVSAEAVKVCRLLFPKRQQHMFLADRY